MGRLVVPAVLACFPFAMPSTPCDYRVVAGPGARELRVEAAFASGLGDRFVFDEGLWRFVREAEVDEGRGRRPTEVRGSGLVLPGCDRRPCRVRYRFLLEKAALALRDKDRAFAHGGAFLAPPSSWLARPWREREGDRCRIRVTTPPGVGFVTGMSRSGGDGESYDVEASDLGEAPYSAFGPFETGRVQVAGGLVDVALAPGERGLSGDDLRDWVKQSAGAVAGYYGRFPLPSALVVLLPGGERAVGYGTTRGGGGASIMVWVGRRAVKADLAADWVLVHEMVHLGFPNLPRAHRWLEEGLATYVEPIARARAGLLPEGDVWQGLVEGLPKGLLREGEKGLDGSRRLGSLYWGGALFCLLADIEIRQRTENQKSFEDAVRGILAAGGTIAVRWPLERVLEEGDRATGVPVLKSLYDRMGAAPFAVDLHDLWRRLGVSVEGGSIRFDETAPLAPLRRSITAKDVGLTPRP